MRKLHPADAADRAAINDAIGFVASIFLGVGQYAKREADTITEARGLARELNAKFAETHRKALVYAILPTGMQIVVPEDHEPAQTAPTAATTNAQETEMPSKHFSKRFNAQRAARSALKNPKAVDGKDFVTKQTGAVWTFSVTKPAAAKPASRNNETPKAAATNLSINRPKTTAKAATTTSATPAGGKRAALEEAARAGKLPPVPDFSKPTHARYRGKLDEVVALVKSKDVKALKAFPINPISTSPKAIDRYRNLAVIALEAAA